MLLDPQLEIPTISESRLGRRINPPNSKAPASTRRIPADAVALVAAEEAP